MECFILNIYISGHFYSQNEINSIFGKNFIWKQPKSTKNYNLQENLNIQMVFFQCPLNVKVILISRSY